MAFAAASLRAFRLGGCRVARGSAASASSSSAAPQWDNLPVSPPSRRPVCTKAAPESKDALPRPDLRKLAQLAKVSLTEEQIEDFQPKVDRVVDW